MEVITFVFHQNLTVEAEKENLVPRGNFASSSWRTTEMIVAEWLWLPTEEHHRLTRMLNIPPTAFWVLDGKNTTDTKKQHLINLKVYYT